MNSMKSIIGKGSIIDLMWVNYCMSCGHEPHCATACDEADCKCNYCSCDNCSGD